MSYFILNKSCKQNSKIPYKLLYLQVFHWLTNCKYILTATATVASSTKDPKA